MRVAFVGASPEAVLAAAELAERGHEVIVIDENQDKIDSVSEQLDCGLVTGDGSRPTVLEEIGPGQTDVLFCVSDRDEVNILAALVGRSLGFERVVPKVEDPELEAVCNELGLDDVMVPDRHVARRLVDLVEDRDSPELTTVVESGLRFLTVQVPDGVTDVAGLELPSSGVLAIARNRDGASAIVDAETRLESKDELVLIVEEQHLDALREQFTPDQR